MDDMTVQVTETMADFVQWANDKGQEEIMKMVNERIMKLKEFGEHHPKGQKDENGFVWDDALEPNDGNDQWKHGGDCNKCRKLNYCLTKCRPNKVLKRITTPFLYQAYLEDHPEAAAKETAKRITPDDVLRMVGTDEAKPQQ